MMTSFAAETRPLPRGEWPAKEADRGGGDTATVNAAVVSPNWSTDTSRKAPARPDPVDLAAIHRDGSASPQVPRLGMSKDKPAKGRRQ